MSANFNRSILACIKLAKEEGFLLQAGNPTSLRASRDFKALTRRSNSYREIYEIGAANQDFNLMMVDYSFFQFTELDEGKELRLAYYPNPSKFVNFNNTIRDALDLFESGELTIDEYEQIVSEEEYGSDIPPVRYDLSLKQYCENYHPAAHLHIGFFSESRWPVRRVLSPYAFMLKIIMIYYSQLWYELGHVSDGEPNKLDLAYRAEIQDCEHIEPEFFKQPDIERMHFV